MEELPAEVLQLIGSFLTHCESEILSFITNTHDENMGRLESRKFSIPAVCVQKTKFQFDGDPRCLDVHDSDFYSSSFCELVKNADGSHAFYGVDGRHYQVYTWSTETSREFASIWCPLEERCLPANYFYYDMLVERRAEACLPKGVAAKLCRLTSRRTLRFVEGTSLQLGDYTVVLSDSAKTRSVPRTNARWYIHQSSYEAINAVINARDSHGTIAVFSEADACLFNRAFSPGTMPQWQFFDHSIQYLEKRLRLNSRIDIPMRVATNVFGWISM